jgi:hypothetical protein
MDRYEEITNGWNYDASCTLTSLLVSGLENFKRLIFFFFFFAHARHKSVQLYMDRASSQLPGEEQ